MPNEAEFAAYLGLPTLNDEQRRCLWAADALVDQALINAVHPLTGDLSDQMVYDVAADFAKRSESTSGQYETQDGNRAPNDPLQRVRAIVKRYTVSGI